MTSPRDTGEAPQPTEDQAAIPQPAEPASTPPEPAPTVPARPPAVTHHRLRRTRVGGVWVGLAVSAVVLLLLLVFILENGQRASIGYFGAHGHLPLGVALLLAAVAGALLVTIPAAGRIIQLRRTARRHRRIDAAQHAAPPGAASPQNETTPTSPAGHQLP